MRKITLLMVLLLITPLVNAELFSPIDQRYIETGSTTSWDYIKIHKITGNEYIGFSKAVYGEIGLTQNGEYIGKMIPIVAGKHPGNGEWYLCPLRNINNITNRELGDNYLRYSGSSNFTCYQYSQPSTSIIIPITINEIMLVVNSTASTKITANITFDTVNPTDTGFGFFFFPENPSLFRYAKIHGTTYDLAGAEGQLPVGKVISFLNELNSPVAGIFDWSDMPNTNYFSEILTVFGKKGILLGSYGYGASNNIYIDPLFQVDFSPNPAIHLQQVDVLTLNDNDFPISVDITSGVSDNSTFTKYSAVNKINIINDKVITGKWSETYTSGYNYFLRVQITTASNSQILVYPYLNVSHINTNYIPSVLIAPSPGFYNINITDLLEYEKINHSMNFSQVRFFDNTTSGIFVAEIWLRKEANDTIPPTINNCYLNQTPVSYGSSAKFYCDVSDNVEVQWVNGTIDGNDYRFNRVGSSDIWEYIWVCNNSGIFIMNESLAEDIVGLQDTLNVSLALTCESEFVYTPINFTNCYYDTNPLIGLKRKIPVVCETTNYDSIGCTLSTYYNGTLLSTSPEISRIMGIGLVNSFQTSGGLLHGYYRQFMLTNNKNFSVRVRCGSEYIDLNISPDYKGLRETTSIFIWARDNLGLIIGVALIWVLAIAAIVGLIARYMKVI